MGQGVGVPLDPPHNSVQGVNSKLYSSTNNDVGGQLRYSQKRITKIDIDLTNARTKERFSVRGTVFWINSGSNADNTVSVTLDSLDNDEFEMSPGAYISGVPFREFYVSNTAQNGESVQVVVITDSPTDRVDVA